MARCSYGAGSHNYSARIGTPPKPAKGDEGAKRVAVYRLAPPNMGAEKEEGIARALFVVDLFIAAFVLAFFGFMHFSRSFPPAYWYMFCAGAVIGATWEIGFYFLGPLHSSSPLYVFRTQPPFPHIVLNLAHCLWDAGLFMAGFFLVRLLLKPPHLSAFRWSELGIMLAWGLAQEIAVEFLSIGGGLWLYQARWYNPKLFEIKGSPFTLLPILVWMASPVVFYLLALPIHRRWGGASRRRAVEAERS